MLTCFINGNKQDIVRFASKMAIKSSHFLGKDQTFILSAALFCGPHKAEEEVQQQ